MILVVGATGVLGRETVPRLLADGQSVRVVARSRERARDLASAGVDVVVADLVDHRSLAAACAGVDRVFACAHSLLGRGRFRSESVDGAGHRALIDAALAARVGRFVYVSASGAAPDHPIDFFRTKHAVERHLLASGMQHVILRPAALMEWHAHAFNGKSMLADGRTLLLGGGTKFRNFVAARDVARVAVHALTAAGLSSSMIEIGGPGNFTNDEVADMYARCAGIAKPRVRHVPAALLRAIAPLARLAHPGIGRVVTMGSLPDEAYGETYDHADDERHVTGTTTLEAFVRERVADARLNARR